MKQVSKEVVEEVPKEPIIKVIAIQSLIESHLTYTGRTSGKQYEWAKAGATQNVDELDVPELLAKRLGGKSCCGGSDGNKIFQLA